MAASTYLSVRHLQQVKFPVKNKPKSLPTLSLFYAYFVLQLVFFLSLLSSFVVVSAIIEKIIAMKIFNSQNIREIKKVLTQKCRVEMQQNNNNKTTTCQDEIVECTCVTLGVTDFVKGS